MEYTDANRGKVQHDGRFRQRLLFDGMRFGNCTPTDIDAVMEIRNQTLILYEVKTGDADVPVGQGLLLKRLVDAWAGKGKSAVLFVCSHNAKRTEDVYLRDAEVTDIYFQGKWWKVSGKTALEKTKDFFEWERKSG